MNDILNVYKEIGETPLEAIERVRKEKKIASDVSMTYAGRLDPMAEGLLILLTGDKVHAKDEYSKLDKEYEFDVLFGFSTDTYDILGLITDSKEDIEVADDQLEKYAFENMGHIEQKYPPFSSKPVEGKPLFQHAREGTLDRIAIPSHPVHIAAFVHAGSKQIEGSSLLELIQERIGKVNGDFRQEEILENWKEQIKKEAKYAIASFKVVVSYGTYVRSIVHELGKHVGVPATTLGIKRTRVGEMRLN